MVATSPDVGAQTAHVTREQATSCSAPMAESATSYRPARLQFAVDHAGSGFGPFFKGRLRKLRESVVNECIGGRFSPVSERLLFCRVNKPADDNALKGRI